MREDRGGDVGAEKTWEILVRSLVNRRCQGNFRENMIPGSDHPDPKKYLSEGIESSYSNK